MVSILRERISGLPRPWTRFSCSRALQTIYTMKPRFSMSRDKDLVRGSDGDPAITTTSVRPPFFARFAFLVFRRDRFAWYALKTTVPQAKTMAPVRNLCRIIQSCALSSRVMATDATDGLGGGLGLMYSGSHFACESDSRTTPAARSTLVSMYSATFSEYCRSSRGICESWQRLAVSMDNAWTDYEGSRRTTTSRKCWSSADMVTEWKHFASPCGRMDGRNVVNHGDAEEVCDKTFGCLFIT